MANPRKFSEKIALHNQKQAEETAAFEAIMREVTATTRQVQPKVPQQPQQHMHLTQPQLGVYRGGSLPNVNQTAIDLQGALHSLEDMKQATGRQSLIDRYHRQRQMQAHRRPFPFDKRADCSPYGAAYLSPPPDTSWRRTNSDSALHTSAMGQQIAGIMQDENSAQTDNLNIYNNLQHGHSRPKSCEVPGINIYPSPEQGQSIPISNNTGSLPDLTTIQFPSPLATPLDTEEQQSQGYTGQGNHTALSPTQTHHSHMGGVLPTQQQAQSSPGSNRRHQQGGPSPLVLQGSPTQMRHNNMNNMSPQGTTLEANVGRLSLDNRSHQYHPYSGGKHQHSPHRGQGHSPNRQSSPSQHSRLLVPCTLPVQLQNLVNSNQSQFVASNVSDSSNICPQGTLEGLGNNLNNVPSLNSSSHLLDLSQQQFNCQNGPVLPSNHNQQNIPNCLTTHNNHPQIVISSIENDDSILNCESNGITSSSSQHTNSLCSNDVQKSQGSPHGYRNSQSDCPPSPNSPVSPHSFSPSQSPGVPPTTLSGSSFSENNYFNQQQVQTQATNALQHQFEQFNMIHENPVTSNYKNMTGMADFSQANFSGSQQDYNIMRAIAAAQQNNAVYYKSVSPHDGGNIIGNGGTVNSHSPHHSPHPPGSPQLPASPQSPVGQHHLGPTSPTQLSTQETYHNVSPQLSPQNQGKKIPDIIFTGADDMLARQDFTKELGNAMALASMNDFDTELFPSDEALKAGLDPLDLDGLQMLTDPTMVTDPATEDSFRLDRL